MTSAFRRSLTIAPVMWLAAAVCVAQALPTPAGAIVVERVRQVREVR